MQVAGGQKNMNAGPVCELDSARRDFNVFLLGPRQGCDARLSDGLSDVEMAAKSPSEAMANPASMISTPKSSSACAMVSFSWVVMLQPGDCSPSRRVVSKNAT